MGGEHGGFGAAGSVDGAGVDGSGGVGAWEGGAVFSGRDGCGYLRTACA